MWSRVHTEPHGLGSRTPRKLRAWAVLGVGQKRWPFSRTQRCLTHLGPACWNFCRTDLAKLLIFYKDLNQRSIMESPANSVSIFLLAPVQGLQMCPSDKPQGAESDAGDPT